MGGSSFVATDFNDELVVFNSSRNKSRRKIEGVAQSGAEEMAK
jgi:hypothetical protein